MLGLVICLSDPGTQSLSHPGLPRDLAVFSFSDCGTSHVYCLTVCWSFSNILSKFISSFLEL